MYQTMRYAIYAAKNQNYGGAVFEKLRGRWLVVFFSRRDQSDGRHIGCPWCLAGTTVSAMPSLPHILFCSRTYRSDI